MKTAMILAAGRGERMRPLTDTLPKPLLNVRGKSLISHHLLTLAAAGFQHVVINHAWLGELIEEQLGNGDLFGLRIHYSPETDAFETAGGIVNALPILTRLMASDPHLLVINGDVFTDFNFATLADCQPEYAHLVLVDNPEHNPDGDFSLNAGKVDRSFDSRLTFSGIAVYHLSIFTDLPREKTALGPILFSLAEKKRLCGEYHPGMWFDIGTPERLEMINKMDGI